jgi:ribose 5-phosphate isomerase B
MKVYLASDHVGFEIKNKLKTFLEAKNYEVVDCGPETFDKDDDYPDFIGNAADAVSKDPESRGVIFGGSGQGEAIVANKYKNVRCALFYASAVPTKEADITGRMSDDPLEMIRLTRDHNDANMLSIGVRFVREEDIMKIVLMWLEQPFSNVKRHIRRIEKIKQIEAVCMK